MSPGRRREMVNREHPKLPIVRQCMLLGVSRSSLYYRAKGASEADLSLMREMDRQYLETPFEADEGLAGPAGYTSKPEAGAAADESHGAAGHLQASQNQPTGARVSSLSLPGEKRQGHPAQPGVGRLTYLPMARGFLYLAAIMDWHSRYVVAWRLSNTLEAGFCAEALAEALARGRPEVFNTGQGNQFSSREVHPGPSGPSREDQHGQEGPVPRQHLRGAAVADGEGRGGLPESLRQRRRGPTGTGSLLPVLQQPETPASSGLPDPCRGVPRRTGYPVGRFEG